MSNEQEIPNAANTRILTIVEAARQSALANVEQMSFRIAEAQRVHAEFITSSLTNSQIKTMQVMMQPAIKALQGFTKSTLFIEAIERQQETMKNLITMVNTRSLLFPPFSSNVIEGHIIHEENQPQMQIIPVSPNAIQIRRLYPVLKTRIGIALLLDGRFIHKRKILKYFSRHNIAGRFLLLLLSHESYSATHEEIGKTFNIRVKEKQYHDAQSLSDIIKALKKAFFKNSLIVELHCERTVGYTLFAIKPLPL